MNILTRVSVLVKRRTSDLDVTGSRTTATKDILEYVMHCWLMAQISEIYFRGY